AVRPVAGEVVRVFSDDELTYDETMEDWRAHIGTDYAATAGEEVKSILGGTVSAVTRDDLYGGCVRVTDGDTELMYAGLDKVSVSEGDTVSAGDVLGTAAERMAAEGAQETHIHVELRTGGAVTDPESLFVQ
ncbi:MAG: peptidoglycan DD-metalloendopeptidase family protein, partial [Butyricicoccaceae bacterium]